MQDMKRNRLIAVVTGGTRRIGLVIAESLVDRGASVAITFKEDAGIFISWSQGQIGSLRDMVLVPQIGNVQDVVRAFEYLIDSPFVTGVALDVNGGNFMI
jgi:NAD(P)-dependent dehydrogenase (short-subunit alcohol dehydrogenase family)